MFPYCKTSNRNLRKSGRLVYANDICPSGNINFYFAAVYEYFSVFWGWHAGNFNLFWKGAPSPQIGVVHRNLIYGPNYHGGKEQRSVSVRGGTDLLLQSILKRRLCPGRKQSFGYDKREFVVELLCDYFIHIRNDKRRI